MLEDLHLYQNHIHAILIRYGCRAILRISENPNRFACIRRNGMQRGRGLCWVEVMDRGKKPLPMPDGSCFAGSLRKG